MNINQFKENLEVAKLNETGINFCTGKLIELYVSSSGYNCARVNWDSNDKFWKPAGTLLSNLFILN